jgi:hypothetical protein
MSATNDDAYGNIDQPELDRLGAKQRQAVLYWMRTHGMDVACQRGEINTTALCEAAAHAFDHDDWLDCETHELWELGLQVGGELSEEHDLMR